jgi:shikimate dehydrogenase
MDRYAVAGNPVEHSRSPFIHARFAEQTRQRMEYTRLLCPLDGFEAAVRRFAAEGGRGCNVTIPFKFAAAALAAHRSARAELAQAVNTLRFDADGWYGDNTDGVGLVRDIEDNAGTALSGCRLLLVGAGGAAAGVLGPIVESRPAEVVVVNRSHDKAQALVRRHADLAARCGVVLRSSAIARPGAAFDVVVNASASSVQGAGSPVPADVLKAGSLAIDLMYGPSARPFLDWARAHGARARDGLGMLVEQAAESFALWRGVRPDPGRVLQALRAEVDAAAPA